MDKPGEVENINPYNQEDDKGEQVERMFDAIAPAYDFMNTAMTFGLHRIWRDKALKAAFRELPEKNGFNALDIATGTGDLAFRIHSMADCSKITGIDLSSGMLEKARRKLDSLPGDERNLIAFGKADCLALPFHEGEFDLVTVAYGVRNFSDLRKGLKEMRRVLKKEGVLCIIELSCPTGKLTALLYKFYSGKLIPFAGKIASGDSRAYSYLPESIAACPQREEMALLLREAGFDTVRWKSLTFGAVTYYIGK